MKKKMIGILVVMLLITIITLPAIGNKILINNIEISRNNREDEVDQNQSEQDWFIPVGVWPYPEVYPPNLNYMVAQGFKPTKDVLTRVELYIGRNRTATYDYVVAIREDLLGPDLTTTSVSAGDIITEDWNWTEFDFDDILVTIDRTYYIVSYTTNQTDNWYAGGCGYGDVYPNGTLFYSTNDGQTWEENSTFDACFKTYGRDNNPPGAPTIKGKTRGAAGVEYCWTFSSVDPDGDDIMYIIDWDDGTTIETECYPSGLEIEECHTYAEPGTYVIRVKAKDRPYGLVGPEATLTVTMPRNRAYINRPFLNFLQQFPNLFPILRLLLQ